MKCQRLKAGFCSHEANDIDRTELTKCLDSEKSLLQIKYKVFCSYPNFPRLYYPGIHFTVFYLSIYLSIIYDSEKPLKSP